MEYKAIKKRRNDCYYSIPVRSARSFTEMWSFSVLVMAYYVYIIESALDAHATRAIQPITINGLLSIILACLSTQVASALGF
jgi:hypothetical protein